MPEATRQLAAIMFTDIVGYTALMGKELRQGTGVSPCKQGDSETSCRKT